MFYLFLGLGLGLIIGGAAVYFALKSSLIPRNIFEELQTFKTHKSQNSEKQMKF